MDSWSWSSGSMPASWRAARTTAARSALWPARVLPDQSRETRTRRPPRPRLARSWALCLQWPGTIPGSGVFGLDVVAEPVGAARGAGQPADLFGQAVDVGLPRQRGVCVVVGGRDV